MPIYEYQCTECDNVFEEWCKSYDQECAPCPECEAEGKRIISNTAFILKGGGWYADGYSNGNGKTAESNGTGDKAASSGDSKAGDTKAAAPAGDSKGGDAKPAKSDAAAKTAKAESKPASGAAKSD